VFGDRKPHLVALLVPEADVANAPDLQQRLAKAVDRVNADVSVIEKVRRFIIADEPFTIQNEQLTPSMKIRRHVLKAVYADRLDSLYKK
jgi:long-chain acyl-CoA synthetase